MKLFYKKSGHGQPFVILHGLFGSLDNWQTVANYLSQYFEVYIIDQRNHGRSPHDDRWNYATMADDVNELVDENNLRNVIMLGHSMGGKTVMQYAAMYPEKLDKIIIADMGPKYYPTHHHFIIKALEAINVDTIQSRKEAEIILDKKLLDASTKQFLLKNLYWTEGDTKRMAWRFNLKAIKENIECVGEEIKISNCTVRALFIKGELSDYVKESDWTGIKSKFTNAELISIAGAGHWLHADKPDEFIKTILDFVNN